MANSHLKAIYARYIECLNTRDLSNLGKFVHEHVIHNDRSLGLQGYRDLLTSNYDEIPDLHFAVQMLICESSLISARLAFDCSPAGEFMGLDINGRRVCFTENVFYKFSDDKIEQVWSVIDVDAIRNQI